MDGKGILGISYKLQFRADVTSSIHITQACTDTYRATAFKYNKVNIKGKYIYNVITLYI